MSEPVAHSYLLTKARIEPNDQPYAEKVIQIESSWNNKAIEPHTKACGLVQEYPCGKSKCNYLNEVCQLKWANHYVHKRYGNWKNALDFHMKKGWY